MSVLVDSLLLLSGVLQYYQELVQEVAQGGGKTKLEPGPPGQREAGHHSHHCLLGKPAKGSYQQNGALQPTEAAYCLYSPTI